MQMIRKKSSAPCMHSPVEAFVWDIAGDAMWEYAVAAFQMLKSNISLKFV